MKSFLRIIGLGFGCLALASGVGAQTWDRNPYGRRDNPYYGNNGYGGFRQSPVDRVLSDLNRAASRAALDRHERKHFDEAARSLQDFQDRWARGRFDTGKLDKAIRNLEHLAQADRVRGWDRNMLARDINELQQFRSGGRFNYGSRYDTFRR